MFEKLALTRMAGAMAAHAGTRLGVVARNIAQADTPGYKAMDLPDFAETYAAASGDGMRSTRPGHIGAAAAAGAPVAQTAALHGSPNGNAVSLEAEMVKSVELRQQHDMALAIYANTGDIIRASLGRGR